MLIPTNSFSVQATKNAVPRRTHSLRFPWNSGVAVGPSVDQGAARSAPFDHYQFKLCARKPFSINASIINVLTYGAFIGNEPRLPIGIAL
jgi:hypothetical protein